MFALAYNLVRSVIAESAGLQGVSPDRVGLLDALRWLIGPGGTTDPERPVDQSEPAGSGRAARLEASAEEVFL